MLQKLATSVGTNLGKIPFVVSGGEIWQQDLLCGFESASRRWPCEDFERSINCGSVGYVFTATAATARRFTTHASARERRRGPVVRRNVAGQSLTLRRRYAKFAIPARSIARLALPEALASSMN